MANKKKDAERRRHTRVKPKDCNIVVNSKIGEVIDISVAGVAFTYIDRTDSLIGNDGIGLLFGEDDLCVDELPVRIISDSAISEGVSVIRRCSARFGKLTPKQLAMLEFLIRANKDDQDPGNNFSA